MAVPHERKTVTYLSLDTLLARGWSPGLIRELLGEPDRSQPVVLYLTPRVEEAERDGAFQRARELSVRRSAALRRAATRRRQSALEAIRTVPLELPRLSPDELARRAVEHRNLLDAQRACNHWGHTPAPASVESTLPAVLVRWKVDYLRHLLARHRVLLEALPPGASRPEGTRLLRERTYAAIAAAYPELALECRRQLAMARRV
ncbi:hypothetical protein [Streptomyces gobiensis]|uniref:hypothetical protein n=1 Tax=Streptomyces gobiensis TaxID=2875706 RepID=UPI001E344792|nr:hypothetical protein [Streptomyces gobiensis]UGY90749.1 hypothetical protein test1122_02745 [Streptomyces gobiensis]